MGVQGTALPQLSARGLDAGRADADPASTDLAPCSELVRQRTREKNQVHAILIRNLKDRSPAADVFGVAGSTLACRPGAASRRAGDEDLGYAKVRSHMRRPWTSDAHLRDADVRAGPKRHADALGLAGRDAGAK